jgi:hypothetical protein
MELERLEPLNWDSDAYFAQAAARRDLTPEQLRARLRGLADESHASAHHIAFEHLRDGSLSDGELTHLDHCNFCSKFLQTVNPKPQTVETFVTAALSRFDPKSHIALAWSKPLMQASRPAPRTWYVPATLVASLALAAVGVSTYYSARHASPEVNALGPLSATATTRCEKASGERRGCELFADAVRYQIKGDSQTAQVLVTQGLQQTGVSEPVIAQVQKALDARRASPKDLAHAVATADAAASAIHAKAEADPTQWLEAARLHVVARQESKAYVAVGHYLNDSAPHAQATAYLVGFAQPVEELASKKSDPTDVWRYTTQKPDVPKVEHDPLKAEATAQDPSTEPASRE